METLRLGALARELKAMATNRIPRDANFMKSGEAALQKPGQSPAIGSLSDPLLPESRQQNRPSQQNRAQSFPHEVSHALPHWLYAQRAAELFERDYPKELNSIADYCRDAHLNVRRCACLRFLAALLNFVISIWYPLHRSWVTALSVALVTSLSLMLEFLSLRDVILPWQKMVGKTKEDRSGFQLRFEVPIIGALTEWWQWLPYCTMSSASNHASLLSTSASMGFSLNGAQVFLPFWGRVLVQLWVLSMFLQMFNALVHHTPGPQKKIAGKWRSFDAWRPAFDRDREGNPESEVRFSFPIAKYISPNWESTHYEAMIEWARIAGTCSILSLFPCCLEEDMDTLYERIPVALSKCREAFYKNLEPRDQILQIFAKLEDKRTLPEKDLVNLIDGYMKKATTIIKLTWLYGFLMILSNRCLLLLFQVYFVLGTPLEKWDTWLSISSSLVVILSADSAQLLKGWKIYKEISLPSSPFRGVISSARRTVRNCELFHLYFLFMLFSSCLTVFISGYATCVAIHRGFNMLTS